MNADEMLLLNRTPELLPVYAALRGKLTQRYGNISIKASKTQISFRNRHIFATVSLPLRRKRGMPGALVVSFGLSYRLNEPRIWQVAQPYPNRWTHHVLIADCADVDDQLLKWLDAAYRFSMIK
ncbi:MAG: DUF5655 domain-containing protein [Eubacteriales bacterium]|nr:DUF5655 domain-containing protein [Eubacteriales bacterium]